MRVSAGEYDGTVAQRVLVYRLGSLGDSLVSLPAMDVVARAFPNAERRLLTNFPIAQKAPPSAAVFENTGLIQSYERYEVGMRNPLKLLGLIWRIRRWKPDVLVYLASPRGLDVAKRDVKFFKLAGVSRIVGVPDTQDLQQWRKYPDGWVEREGDRLSRTVAALGTPAAESYRLRFSEEEMERAAALLQPLQGRPFFAVSLGAKLEVKDWGIENWKALIPQLAKAYPQHGLVFAGAGEDVAPSEEVAAVWRASTDAPALNLCGQLSVRQSGTVFALADAYLGHDSGPMHLAAASGVKCVGIFPARNPPGRWFPFGEGHQILYHRVSCSPCELNVCIEEGKRCILSITVDEVMDAVRVVMEEGKKA